MQEDMQYNINPVRNTNFPQHQNNISNGVKCPIFFETDEVIKNTILKFEKAALPKEKQYYAQDVLIEADTLLNCLNYSPTNPDCKNCHDALYKYINEYEHFAKEKSSFPSL